MSKQMSKQTLHCSECGALIFGIPLLILARRGKRAATQATFGAPSAGAHTRARERGRGRWQTSEYTTR